MLRSMARQTNMNKENVPAANIQKPTARITRARAKALGLSDPKHEPIKVLQPNSKRGSSDNKLTDGDSISQPKRRAVLSDVTNKALTDLNMKAINEVKIQTSKQTRSVVQKNAMVAPAVSVGPRVLKGKIKTTKDMTKQNTTDSRQITAQQKLVNDLESKPSVYYISKALVSSSPKGEFNICKKEDAANYQAIIDIDSKHKDPQMCSLYAAEFFTNLRAIELKVRPSVNYMKTAQRDITQEMRGILIDWLVEVCEEYKQTSETLYLTVTLIDQYLSKMYIAKQRLQLLGITCMLIASRFIFAAQSSYKAPVLELEYLAKYLAELTLTEYSFLKFLPSLVAASAVFLAKWTLDQVEHPWNPTLEHYTNYKASDLKATVLALQDVQLNNRPTLHAIRQKYMQNKFNNVATLTSEKPVKPLF